MNSVETACMLALPQYIQQSIKLNSFTKTGDKKFFTGTSSNPAALRKAHPDLNERKTRLQLILQP
jgi:hypothetical protein